MKCACAGRITAQAHKRKQPDMRPRQCPEASRNRGPHKARSPTRSCLESCSLVLLAASRQQVIDLQPAFIRTALPIPTPLPRVNPKKREKMRYATILPPSGSPSAASEVSSCRPVHVGSPARECRTCLSAEIVLRTMTLRKENINRVTLWARFAPALSK